MYIVDFSIMSFVFLTITTIFYFKQNKIQNTRTRFFSALLILGECSLLLDVAVAVMDKNMDIAPFILYLGNFLFLLSAQLNGQLFLGYVLVLTGMFPRIKTKYRLLMLIPFGVVFALLSMSPFTDLGIFQIAGDNSYVHGKTHMALYVVVASYIITAVVITIIKFRRIQKRKIFTVLSFVTVSFLTMIVQMFNPYLLVNSMGNALALTIMCFSLQAPDENVDSLTRLLNRRSMDTIINDLFEQNQPFTLTMFALNDFQFINHEYGIKGGDDLMVAFANYLKKKFPKDYVIRITGDVYGVINFNNQTPLTSETLEKYRLDLPETWNLADNNIKMPVSIVGINSEDLNNKHAFLNIINYIVMRHDDGNISPVVLVNEKYQHEFEYYIKAEQALAKALEQKTLKVYYQPIHDSFGKLVAYEALSRLIDDEIGFVSPDLFITIAERNGSIYALGELVLEKVCEFIKEYHVEKWNLHHIGVNLSVLQCTNATIHKRLLEIMAEYEFAKDIISFEITETSSTTAMPLVKKSMNHLIDAGYVFMLDDFGSGYANYNYVLELPFTCIKIDKMILWQAMKDPSDMLYLETLVKSLQKLNYVTICEGVETAEQAEVLANLGVTMQQGYLYSKALPPSDANDYSKRCLGILEV